MEKKRALILAKSLKELRQPRDEEFRELERYFGTRRGLFQTSNPGDRMRDRANSSRVNRDILDSTPIRALRIMASGMQSGMTSPSRPWFTWQATDPALRERPAVRAYIAKATDEARTIIQKSGLYRALHAQYKHLGQFGTSAMILDDARDERLVVPNLFAPGSYWIGSAKGDGIDTLYRELSMTVEQIVAKFVFTRGRFGAAKWENVPTHIKTNYDRGDLGKQYTVHHLYTPRRSDEIEPGRLDGANKRFASVYWMDEHRSSDKFPDLMGQFGYGSNRLVVPRWEADEFDPYGYAPACDALPDARELMAKRRDYAELLRRINRPTMNAHTDLRNSAFSLLPGAINFMADPTKGMRPTFETPANFGPLSEDIKGSQQSIWSLLYADLFMMISDLDRRQITATEIDARKEEKMLELGPVVERLQNEQDEPVLDIIFEAVARKDSVGPPPQELEGHPLKVDYTSILAQAQKAVSTGGIERLWSFAGNLVAVKPDILDKLDSDQTIDEYSDLLGTPPGIVRTDEDVAKLRADRQQQQQMQQAAQMAPGIASAAKDGAQAAQVLAAADAPRSAAPIDTLRKLGLA